MHLPSNSDVPVDNAPSLSGADSHTRPSVDHSYHDGSNYDPVSVAFFDPAHEGARLRALATEIGSPKSRWHIFEGLCPRSITIISGDSLSTASARLGMALIDRLPCPVTITDSLPPYAGALDVVIVATQVDSPIMDEAVSTAASRGCITVVVAEHLGLLEQ